MPVSVTFFQIIKLKLDKLIANCTKPLAAFDQLFIGDYDFAADLVNANHSFLAMAAFAQNTASSTLLHQFEIFDSPIMLKELSTLNVAPILSILKMTCGTSIRFSGTGLKCGLSL